VTVDKSWRRIALAIVGVGGLIVAGGVLMGLDSLRYVLLGARAEGAVVAIERDGDLYVPAVRFSLPSGEAVEVRERGAGRRISPSAMELPFSTFPKTRRTSSSGRSNGSGWFPPSSRASEPSV
jgi:hypothetical protein